MKQLNFFEHLGEILRPETDFVNALPMPTQKDIANKFNIPDGFATDLRQENSREAQKAIQPHLSRLHSIILSALNNLGGEATKDEIAAFTCLKSEQVHKRMSELEKQGKVIPNGKRKGDAGVNITIWKIKV